MTFELCTDSFEGALMAEKFAIKRIELCSALSEGGLTPSYGLIKKCTKLSIKVHVMIRPRGGNFQYTSDEIDIMKSDIESAKNLNASGVVFGVLNDQNEVDNINESLVLLAKSLGLEVTFHRAFDLVLDPFMAMKKLIDFKFDRILTSGLHEKAIDGIDLLLKLQKKYGERIQIMAGSGVNHENAMQFSKIGIKNIHFTSHKSIKDVELRMGSYNIPNPKKLKSILNCFNL